MVYDVFLSICQTEVDGKMPSERVMFENFFSQLKLADELGYETAWVAETHLSCQVQKETSLAVIPHFKGEIGLNTDILQLAHKVFAMTKNINVGSAIRNILCNGGPIAHAEAIKTFMTYHSMDPEERRRLNIGFASGRFPFSNAPYGIVPRNQVEQAAWPALRGKILQEATEIFLRLLKGEVIASKDIRPKILQRKDFRSDADWEKVQQAYAYEVGKSNPEKIEIDPYWSFEKVGVIPFEAPMDLLDLTLGTHDAPTQLLANEFMPVGVFNLSITPPKVIEETHERMKKSFHRDGGPWKRSHMPRTAMVFIDDTPGASEEEKNNKAQKAATKANGIYWQAMEGTLDPDKVAKAVGNALVGSPTAIAEQIKSKYHPEDRLMLWFDFNNHNNDEVSSAMRTFKEKVAPELDSWVKASL